MAFEIMAAFFVAVAVFFLLVQAGSQMGGKQATVKRRLEAITAQSEPSEAPRRAKKGRMRRPGGKHNVPAYVESLAQELALADIPMRTNEFMLFALFATVTGAVVLYILLGTLAAVVGAVAGGSVMPVWLSRKKKKRMKLLENQLSDALTVISNALRAGFSFQQALDSVVSSMGDPIAKEFGVALREAKLGLPLEKALQKMSDRLQQDDLSLLISAVLIQKQVGGNLSEILDNIGDTIRERLKIRGQIKTLTAQGRMSGIIIGLLPVFILAFLMMINPSYVQLFFTTAIGKAMIGAAVVLEIVGFVVVRKVVNIKF